MKSRCEIINMTKVYELPYKEGKWNILYDVSRSLPNMIFYYVIFFTQ